MAKIVPANAEHIEIAAKILQRGGLVAFPTETVYGLGADALNAEAVGRIFVAKGRPATNPIIVHVADRDGAEQAAIITPLAHLLMQRFWPGPLTLVLRKTDRVPDIVTAGGATVGIRMPAHPVAQALILQCGSPLAAPSANRSESISPTTAEHVSDSLGDNIELILDGGPCSVGIESTVLDLASSEPRILRPGMIDLSAIESVIGQKLGGLSTQHRQSIARSPGQMKRHYAPSITLTVVSTDAIVEAWSHGACKTSFLLYGDKPEQSPNENVCKYLVLPPTPQAYAAALYAAMHKLDRSGAQQILVQQPPESSDWDGVRDRLQRASAGKNI